MTRPDPQTGLLTRTFFSRMFESDLMPPGLPQTQLIFSVIAFLAAPSLLGPILLAKKYIPLRDPAVKQVLMAQDRALLLLLGMLATAVVTLVIWENVFPDRRDSRTLGVLPIARGSFVVARLSAIVGVFLLVFAGSTVLSAASFGTVQAMFGAPGGIVGTVLGHFVALSGLQAFVFFGILAAQCVVINLLGTTLAHRVAVLLQMLTVVVFLQVPLILPPREAFLMTPSGPAWAQGQMMWASPPLWFVALYEAVANGGYRGTLRIAAGAAALAVTTPLLALGLYAGSYRRLTRLAIEGRPAAPRSARGFVPGLVARVVRWTAPAPAAAGVCAFTVRTLARSRQHRMLFAMWLGLGLAFIVSSLLPLFVNAQPGALDHPRTAVLVVPLLIVVVVQVGMRSLFPLPTEIKANWTFRLAQPASPSNGIAGATCALFLCGVVPSVAVAFVTALWLWGFTVALMHASYCGLVGAILTQVLMRGVDKIPFTCTYVPGKARLTKFWPAYLVAFSFLTFGMAALDVDLLRSTIAWVAIMSLLVVVSISLWWLRRIDTRRVPALRFEEEPLDEPTLIHL